MSLISVCKVAQNKDYRYKEGLSLVINIVQEIWEKNVMTNLDLESAQNSILSNDIYIYSGAVHLLYLLCPSSPSYPSFLLYVRSSWMARNKEEGEALLQILPVSMPEVLPKQEQQQRKFTMTPACVSAPADDEQVLQSCQNLHFI